MIWGREPLPLTRHTSYPQTAELESEGALVGKTIAVSGVEYCAPMHQGCLFGSLQRYVVPSGLPEEQHHMSHVT